MTDDSAGNARRRPRQRADHAGRDIQRPKSRPAVRLGPICEGRPAGGLRRRVTGQARAASGEASRDVLWRFRRSLRSMPKPRPAIRPVRVGSSRVDRRQSLIRDRKRSPPARPGCRAPAIRDGPSAGVRRPARTARLGAPRRYARHGARGRGRDLETRGGLRYLNTAPVFPDLGFLSAVRSQAGRRFNEGHGLRRPGSRKPRRGAMRANPQHRIPARSGGGQCRQVAES